VETHVRQLADTVFAIKYKLNSEKVTEQRQAYRKFRESSFFEQDLQFLEENMVTHKV